MKTFHHKGMTLIIVLFFLMILSALVVTTYQGRWFEKELMNNAIQNQKEFLQVEQALRLGENEVRLSKKFLEDKTYRVSDNVYYLRKLKESNLIAENYWNCFYEITAGFIHKGKKIPLLQSVYAVLIYTGKSEKLEGDWFALHQRIERKSVVGRTSWTSL